MAKNHRLAFIAGLSRLRKLYVFIPRHFADYIVGGESRRFSFARINCAVDCDVRPLGISQEEGKIRDETGSPRTYLKRAISMRPIVYV